MKELDFLPEWYKDGQRRRVHVRRQCVALVAVFLVMMLFNAMSLQRAGRAAAEGARLENQRVGAEAVVHEFDALTRQLNELKSRAGLVEQMDSRVDVAAVLAELSHVISGSIVVRKLEIQAERFGRTEDKGPTKGSAVRLADGAGNAVKDTPLGRVKFRIVLAGVAAHPADVANLVYRLDESTYFQRVHPIFYGAAKAQTGAKSVPPTPEEGAAVKPQSAWDVTEFEIACYLANYKETEE